MPTAREQAKELFEAAFPGEESKTLGSTGAGHRITVKLKGTKVLVRAEGLRSTILSASGARGVVENDEP